MKRIKVNKNEVVKAVYLNGLLQNLGKTEDYTIDSKGIKFKNSISKKDTNSIILDITKTIHII